MHQQSTLLPDHFSIKLQINLSSKTYTPRLYHHRKINNIDYISFKTDLYNSTLTTKYDPSSLTTSLYALLVKHAPLIHSKISIYTNSPWFNSDFCSFKRHTRKLDKLYRKMPTHHNHSNLRIHLFWHVIDIVITCFGPNLNSTNLNRCCWN